MSQEKPTGLTFQDLQSLSVQFEGKEVHVWNVQENLDGEALVELGPEEDDARILLVGYFDENKEFIELDRS